MNTFITSRARKWMSKIFEFLQHFEFQKHFEIFQLLNTLKRWRTSLHTMYRKRRIIQMRTIKQLSPQNSVHHPSERLKARNPSSQENNRASIRFFALNFCSTLATNLVKKYLPIVLRVAGKFVARAPEKVKKYLPIVLQVAGNFVARAPTQGEEIFAHSSSMYGQICEVRLQW